MKINSILKTSLVLIITMIIVSCSTSKKLKEQEQDLLEQYLSDNNITTLPTTSGLYYIENEVGTGSKAIPGDKVKVHYAGFLITGEKFDSSYDRGVPFEFTLGVGQVIKGWDEGIAYMNVGSKATLIIPSELAYGSTGAGSIPPYSTLIFNVELISIE